MSVRRATLALLPLCAGLLLAALTVSLGNWQLRRADEKGARQAQLDALARLPPRALPADARAAEGQPLRLAGTWLPQAGILLDNRTHGGRAGYHVLTPLALDDGSGVVLVNRGWIAAAVDRRLPASPRPPAGLQQVEGRARFPPAAPFTLATSVSDASGRLWQSLDLPRYAGAWRLGEGGRSLPPCEAAAPPRGAAGALASASLSSEAIPAAAPCVAAWIVQQTSAAADGLVRDWPAPSAGVDRHRGYAFQWYALAGLAAALTAWYAWRLFSRRLGDDRNPRLAGG